MWEIRFTDIRSVAREAILNDLSFDEFSQVNAQTLWPLWQKKVVELHAERDKEEQYLKQAGVIIDTSYQDPDFSPYLQVIPT